MTIFRQLLRQPTDLQQQKILIPLTTLARRQEIQHTTTTITSDKHSNNNPMTIFRQLLRQPKDLQQQQKIFIPLTTIARRQEIHHTTTAIAKPMTMKTKINNSSTDNQRSNSKGEYPIKNSSTDNQRSNAKGKYPHSHYNTQTQASNYHTPDPCTLRLGIHRGSKHSSKYQWESNENEK